MATQGPASGETSLKTLLSTLTTRLDPETFVFLNLPPTQTPPDSLQVHMLFKEVEGITLISTKSSAEAHGLEYIFPCKMVTLNIHSSLEAVGFMAAITRKLTEKGIGCNPVSGYFHDHLFVPAGREDETLEVLSALAVAAKSGVEN